MKMDSLSNIVLITGINGFTGKYLKKYLSERNFQVFGISNVVQEKDENTYPCDINNLLELTQIIQKIQPDFIIHLAAISFVQHTDIEEMYKVNVLGTQNLLDACLSIKSKIKKIILASSATVYGNQNTEVLHEELAPNPNNHYGISKWAMEQVAKNYFQDLPIIITRPFNYTAPGQEKHFIIPKIAQAFTEKRPIIELGNIDVYREYNSIEFVCDCYYQLLIIEQKSEIVNICSGKTYSIREILQKFTEITNHSIEVKINPEFVRKNEIFRLSGDPKKLNSIINDHKNNFLEEIVNDFINIL